MSIVVCKLPRAGLGNQLFPLMNAFLFGKLNNLEVIVTGCYQLKAGPYLRNEKSKRNYSGYFSFQERFVDELANRLKIKNLKRKSSCIYEPKIERLDSVDENVLFIFEQMPDYHDYFVRLKAYRREVTDLLFEILSPKILNLLEQKAPPAIGVHIRMGDFRKLNNGEAYASGHVRAPEEYFINTINEIRRINGKEIPVAIFTDGYEKEFRDLLKLKNITIIKYNPDIVDLVLLSRSQLIVTSQGSTFSAWASFLSNAPVVSAFPYEKPLREDTLYSTIYEGPMQIENELLISNIKRLHE